VKLRQRVTKGAGSRAAGLAMAFKLLLAAERSWRRLNGHELLPLVAAGVVFRDGVRVEREVATDTKPTIKKGRMKKTEIEEVDAA
jgi:single-stranded DNA-specific DHH superfamily exonuclease